MKVGDLVKLSAKGRALKGNSSFLGGVGIVLEIGKGSYYDLGVKWFCKNHRSNRRVAWFKRYEIKKLKPDKKCP